MSTILVTGGGGFIGSNLVVELLERGLQHRVVVCDRFGKSEQWRNLVHHMPSEIIAPEELPGWLAHNRSELEMVFHIGALSSTVETDVDLILAHNTSPSLKLWRWCAEHNVRFIYASSSVTYGAGEHGFDDDLSLEYLRRLRPLTPYGWSKNLFDLHVAECVARQDKLPPQWVGLKIFNAYGPNEYHKASQRSVACQIAPQAMHVGTVRLFKSYHPKYKDGGQLRDLIYVKDVVDVMLWLMDNPKVSGLFNVGSGKARSFNDLALAIFAALGKKPNIHYIDMPETVVNKYQYFTEAKMDRLRAAGYQGPIYSLEEGIKDYVQNYLAKEDPYR